MVVPYADASADSPVLLRQVFVSNFGYSIGRYFLQLLYEPSHCFKGGYHLEDSYDKALACDPVQGVSVLGLDLRDRSFYLVSAWRGSSNLVDLFHQEFL